MKPIHFLSFFFIFLQILYAKNPIPSPTFDDILKEIIKNDSYIFDNEKFLTLLIIPFKFLYLSMQKILKMQKE